MNLFGSSDGPGEEEDSVEYELREETKEKEYTVHTATATFIVPGVGLVEREYEFDAIAASSNKYILSDYTDYDPGWGNFSSEKVVTIQRGDLATFETTERRTETMEFTTTERVPVDDEEDE